MGVIRFKNILNVFIRNYCAKDQIMPKYLNVAEKNDAAKNIAAILSKGNSSRREGKSPYNKIYEFECNVLGQQSRMVMTSVSGHLLNYAFTPHFKSWLGCNPVSLFEAPIIKICPPDYEKIKATLEREIRGCNGLIIWTDCDREGENIGFEIIKVCSDVIPNLRIYRAKFSEITGPSVFRALQNLGQPDKNVSDAVDVRQELDLRTGAAFTRLQTLRLQKVFPAKLADKLISYGSCQFPTLGFVVDRYQQIEKFIPENFWKIKMSHTVKELTTDFTWKRDRLFDKNSVEAILDICKENSQAKVESVESKPKSKWRPVPLDTVEMEKSASKKLRMNAKEAMKVAEKLYTKGLISYPRTETNIFPKELNLTNLVEMQRQDHNWGLFATRIMNEGGPNPRQGKKSDQAHPPIHPTKYANNLSGNEQKLYEFIVRHFLACVHKDAQGFETVVNVDIADEKFTAKGLIILERNYLDVYIYEKWSGKEINNYAQGDTFMPTVLEMAEGTTSPPKLLTEADLIALMEKHGIGTDATHAEHIETIKQREYVGLHENIYFVPGTLGMGLVEGYNNIGLEISLAKPTLRADFENDLKLICEGRKNAEEVRVDQIRKYKEVFQMVAEKMRLIDDSLAVRLDDRPQEAPQNIQQQQEQHNVSVLKCPKCNNDMYLRTKKDGQGRFISCSGYPGCKNAVWLPAYIENAEVTEEHCPQCGPDTRKIKFKFKPNPFPGEPNPNTLCIGGCDYNICQTLDVNISNVRRDNSNQTRSSNSNPSVTSNSNNRPVTNRPNNTINNWLNVTTNSPNNTRNNNSSRIEPTQSRNTGSSSNNANRNRNWVSSDFPSTSSGNRSSLDLMAGPSSRPTNSFTNDGNSDNEIVCNCNNPAVLLTVRKEGANKGRQFYKCASSTCNYFLWDPNDSQGPSTSFNNSSQDQVPQCNCHLPAVQKTVQKEGPNKGRQFYCCSKPIGQGCKFFQWCDEDGNTGGGGGGGDDWGGGGGGGRGRGRGNSSWKGKTKGKNTKRSAPYDGQTKAKRKCGLCGEEGHMRNKCPNA
ncbi:DNA topoisomerase 3-alpha [Aethina tumida]|uniref:DNA topoisomerase 3-alpha n=1 Tax=Aethina tumida TaxID=116153 RepID=UPI002148D399|nr:DNA topoisomerase 3-alpha [Aethina tumida]